VSGHWRCPPDEGRRSTSIADFQPIAMVGVSTALLCVPPIRRPDIASFVALRAQNPGKLNYLNSGNGTSSHLCPSSSRSDRHRRHDRSPTRACRPACRTCWPPLDLAW
jgi:tripartite-type tricarboxylate transporter receptor subunit TctC